MIDVSAGVPGVNAPEPATFEEFWPLYVSQHLHPMTQRTHVIGMSLGLVSLAVAAATLNPFWALGLPAFAYGFAVPSHFIWEGNTPALLGGRKAFFWSIRSDLRQWFRFVTGRLAHDTAAVRVGLNLPAGSLTMADAAA